MKRNMNMGMGKDRDRYMDKDKFGISNLDTDREIDIKGN